MDDEQATAIAYMNKTWGDHDPKMAAEVGMLPEPLQGKIRCLLDEPMGAATGTDIEALAAASGFLAALAGKRGQVFNTMGALLDSYGPGTTIGKILHRLPTSVQEVLTPVLERDIYAEPLTGEECDRILAALGKE